MANVGVIATYPLFHGFYPDGDPLIGGLFTRTKQAPRRPRRPIMTRRPPCRTKTRLRWTTGARPWCTSRSPMLWRLETPTGVQLWAVDNIIGSGGGAGEIPPSTVGVNHGDVSIGLVA